MAENSLTYKVFEIMGSRLKSIGCSYYLQDRPLNIPEKTDRFVVLRISGRLYDRTKGFKGSGKTTSGLIYAFQRSKSDGTPNIKKLTSLERDVMNLFPISETGVCCTHPRWLSGVSDGYGFNMSSIIFDVRINLPFLDN